MSIGTYAPHSHLPSLSDFAPMGIDYRWNPLKFGSLWDGLPLFDYRTTHGVVTNRLLLTAVGRILPIGGGDLRM